tara:strand:- start:37 stop:276 length:240 start_codon:yes stop_codon:yes gene_type:complete
MSQKKKNLNFRNSPIFKKVKAFAENKPQSITLDIPQLEKLANLEAAAYCLWEDLKYFNDEIGNNHFICNDCESKKEEND